MMHQANLHRQCLPRYRANSSKLWPFKNKTSVAGIAKLPLGAFRSLVTTGPDDKGLHTLCIAATAEFLEFSRAMGNDLSTPIEQYDFRGLKPGDHWRLRVTRWVEAFQAGKAPSVVLEATHVHALEFIPLEDLQAHAAKQ